MKRTTTDKAMNTIETRGSRHDGVYQAEEAKRRLATLTHEHHAAQEEIKTLKLDLEHCSAFLEVQNNTLYNNL